MMRDRMAGRGEEPENEKFSVGMPRLNPIPP
jgi:hypothetical protein